MDTEFAIYQARMHLRDLLLRKWTADITTIEYWGIVAFIALYYVVWWKLTDKRRISDLLLFGSFVAVMRVIVDLLGTTLGLWYYKVTILPVAASIFLHEITLSPLTHMLALQYSPNWKQFFTYSALAAAWIHMIMIPISEKVGIYQPMNWNVLFGFLTSYIAAILSRAAFHLVKQVQHKAVEGYDSPFMSTLAQPAFKPVQTDKKEHAETKEND